MNNHELMRALMQESYRWIMQQRSSHALFSARISDEDRTVLRKYFTSRVLDGVRVAFVDCIDNPPFYARLAKYGMTNPIDFREMLGITFVDRILMRKTIARDQKERLPILFHELVHVLQYSTLGARRFIEQYLTAWFTNGGSYEAIPIEKQAYDLQHRFEKGEQFSVERKLGIVILF